MREHVPAETLEREFRAAAALSVRNILRGEGPALSFVVGIAGQLASRTRTRNYCPAFNTQLSISAQGDAFPCFMFYGDPRMNMGNIFAADFPGPRAREIWSRYAAEFGALPTGDDDWCSALVSGCVAGDYLATSGFSERPYRAVNRAMIEEVLLGLSRVANVQPA
jgi:radical SAM protein with 4Fe4S-binding SPASM domain